MEDKFLTLMSLIIIFFIGVMIKVVIDNQITSSHCHYEYTDNQGVSGTMPRCYTEYGQLICEDDINVITVAEYKEICDDTE